MTQKTHLIIGMLVLFSTSISFAQALEQYQWKNRMLIITAKNKELLNSQVEILAKDNKGLEERKLVVQKVLPDRHYRLGLHSKLTHPLDTYYWNMRRTKKDFEIILIGLDGGVKLRQTELLSLEKLFALIDGMPMRKQELKKN